MVNERERKRLEKAWDEGCRAANDAWVAMVSWAIKDPKRETAPKSPTNPYALPASSSTDKENNDEP